MKKLLYLISATFFLSCAPSEKEVKEELQKIENQVAQDAEQQYKIAKRNGTAADAYAAAMMVSAAYLQANDEPNYKKWKEIEKQEAKAAGMPQ